MQFSLVEKAGKRQKCLLLELEKIGVIRQDKETGLWTRGPLASKIAKDLLQPTDCLIDEQIKELEPFVLRLEKEAEKLGAKLSGQARQKLNYLHELKKLITPARSGGL